jgi:hypothetical protein
MTKQCIQFDHPVTGCTVIVTVLYSPFFIKICRRHINTIYMYTHIFIRLCACHYNPVLRRQAMYVSCNTQEFSCNHSCSKKPINSTYSECVCILALLIWNALYYIVTCGLSGSTHLHYLKNGTVFIKNFIECKMCVLKRFPL